MTYLEEVISFVIELKRSKVFLFVVECTYSSVYIAEEHIVTHGYTFLAEERKVKVKFLDELKFPRENHHLL